MQTLSIEKSSRIELFLYYNYHFKNTSSIVKMTKSNKIIYIIINILIFKLHNAIENLCSNNNLLQPL
jgi:hypothetical protein